MWHQHMEHGRAKHHTVNHLAFHRLLLLRLAPPRTQQRSPITRAAGIAAPRASTGDRGLLGL